MNPTSIYLYCIADFKILQENKPQKLFPEMALTFLADADLVAIISQENSEDWTGEAAEKNLQDLNWIGPRACAHEKVIEQVMQHSPVLPARFGTLFYSEASLSNHLKKHHQAIAAFLAYVSDKTEFGVKAFLNRAKAQASLVNSEVKGQEQPVSQGVQYLLAQRQKAEAQKKIGQWYQLQNSAVIKRLEKYCLAMQSLKNLSQEVTGLEEEMVLNLALLVLKDQQADFFDCLTQIRQEYSPQGLIFKISGPWPPYNFCPILNQE